jgi:hypothetical protein
VIDRDGVFDPKLSGHAAQPAQSGEYTVNCLPFLKIGHTVYFRWPDVMRHLEKVTVEAVKRNRTKDKRSEDQLLQVLQCALPADARAGRVLGESTPATCQSSSFLGTVSFTDSFSMLLWS